MVYKQDFTNVLDLEIAKLEKHKEAIEGELKARENLFNCNYVPLMKEDQRSVEYWQNKRAIANLESELSSKTEFLFKLRDKKLFDNAELNEDYEDMLKNYQGILDKIDQSGIEDPHDVLRVNYMRDEFLLWISEPEENPSKKEASIFFYKGVKTALKECGILIKE